MQALAASPTVPSLATALQGLHADAVELLGEQIEVQQWAGQLPAWVRPSAMARLVVAVVHGTMVASLIDPAHADAVSIGAQFAHLLLGARTDGSSAV